MSRFFAWFRNLFRPRGSNWPGFKAIDTAKVDSGEDWRRMNNS